MRKTTTPRLTDSERVAAWRDGLIADLGPDVALTVRWMHQADAGGLVIVLRALRRLGVSESIQQGVSLYWRQLTAEKNGQTIPKGGV